MRTVVKLVGDNFVDVDCADVVVAALRAAKELV